MTTTKKTPVMIAAEAIQTASRISGLVTIWVDYDLLTRLCELGLLREDREYDVFVDQEGYNWLRDGADMDILARLLGEE